MANSMKLGLLLLCLVLSASSVTPARISGKSMVADGSTRGETRSSMAAAAAAGDTVIMDNGVGGLTGCHRMTSPFNPPAPVFCCMKGPMCWPSLQQCKVKCDN